MKPTQEQMNLINSRLPQPIKPEQVEVLPFMVFDQEVTDRFTVATPEFLRKMVKDMSDGKVALNLMHQSRTTLPVGRSVNGNFKGGKAFANMYAVVQRPDGTPMEDGKDLADKYNTGAVFAASAGVKVGFYKCSICGFDFRDYENCSHWPGEWYTINESTGERKRCILFMTGHDVQDGVAMDCGCYEVSAVTAGGVEAAGLTTESFSKYDGTDVKEFKKGHEDDIKKTYDVTRVSLGIHGVAEPYQNTEGGTDEMSLTKEDVLALVKETYGDLPDRYATLEKAGKELQEKYAALETVKADLEGKLGESTAKIGEFEAKIAEFEAKVAELEPLAAFKAEYVGLVTADAARAGKEVGEGFESKPLDELKAFHAECIAAIAALPTGQQTVTEGHDTFAAMIPEELYSTEGRK